QQRVVPWCFPVVLAGCSTLKSRSARRACLKALATRNLVKRGKILPAQPVPEGILAPPYVADPDKVRGWWNSRIEPKSDSDVEAMRSAGQLAHSALDLAAELIRPGITSEEMDKELHTFICDHGAYPSDLQYKGFPKSVMISINEVICHGIPDSRPLEDGDLVNVDVTLYRHGFHADTARTWMCGEEDEAGGRLVAATREALDAAIAVCRPAAPLKAIGEAVADIAEREGFGIVKTLVGHGIGEFFHGVPQIFHCRNSDNRKMQEGTTFTIEPVLTEGSPEWFTWEDGWTVATKDGGRAAQFEHTILITSDGCEVLT
ncbi:MAP1D, partial [Symbiodinium pilosum]